MNNFLTRVINSFHTDREKSKKEAGPKKPNFLHLVFGAIWKEIVVTRANSRERKAVKLLHSLKASKSKSKSDKGTSSLNLKPLLIGAVVFILLFISFLGYFIFSGDENQIAGNNSNSGNQMRKMIVNETPSAPITLDKTFNYGFYPESTVTFTTVDRPIKATCTLKVYPNGTVVWSPAPPKWHKWSISSPSGQVTVEIDSTKKLLKT